MAINPVPGNWTDRRSLAPLILGVIMIVVGGLFLAVNVFDFEIRWWGWVRYVVPLLLLAWGLSKLYRHFTWREEQLAAHPVKSGLLSGLFWTTVGGFWLVDRFHDFEVVATFGLYWPLILVAFGFGKVIDYYRLEGRLQVRVGEIFGILFLLLAGFAAGKAGESSWPTLRLPDWEEGAGIRIRDLEGERHTWTESVDVPANGVNAIRVENFAGDVRVEPSEEESIGIVLDGTATAATLSVAEENAAQLGLKTVLEGETLRVSIERGQLEDSDRVRSNLRISAPRRLAAQVLSRFGEVSVDGRDGMCRIENSSGTVRVEDVTAGLEVTNEYAGTEVRDVAGEVRIQSRRGAVEIRNVRGQLYAETDYESLSATGIEGDVSIKNRFGVVRIDSVQGKVEVEAPGSEVEITQVSKRVTAVNSHKTFSARELEDGLSLESSYGSISLVTIRGPVDLKTTHAEVEAQDLGAGITLVGVSSAVSLEGVKGAFKIASSLREIRVEDFEGPGEVQNEYGTVELISGSALLQELVVTNKNGEIILSVPQDSSFRLVAQAPGGEVRSEFGQTAPTASLETTVGRGGPEVRLQTNYANIRIQKSS